MIRWRTDDGEAREGDLFSAFAALARGEARDFPALRPHQREPWHAFCVQVATLALRGNRSTHLPAEPSAWREALIGLTPDWPAGEAWTLVIEDWTKPALLQPPIVAEADRDDYKNRVETPDALDMLVTSKNHDVKAARMRSARDEDWLFALVTLQTFEGFLGAGNYGISRMNGGFASRMTLGVRPAGGAAAAFKRDVARLLANTADARGIDLLWTVPWDGTLSLAFDKLDPLYVDICRRVRLRRGESGLVAFCAGSKVARVEAKALKGNTGDPWAPLKAGDSASVTPTASGFGYRQISALLDWRKTVRPRLAKLELDDDAEGLTLVVSALVRGQGKTEGFHRRAIELTRVVTDGFDESSLDRMGEVARVRMEAAAEAGRRLRGALISLVQGGPERARLDDDAASAKVRVWLSDFDSEVDRIFFDAAFWSEFAKDPGNHAEVWRKTLRDVARAVFDRAAASAPRTDMRRVRARARSLNRLEGGFSAFIKESAT